MKTKLRAWLSPLVYLSNNWISLTGVVVVTAATVTWIVFLPITLRGGVLHPYFGLVVYLLLPGIFVGGLLLIPIGIYWNRRRKRSKGEMPSDFPTLDPGNPELRKLALFVVGTTFFNIIIASQFSYSAVRYMDTVSFCGQTCHVVMQPEFTAHQHRHQHRDERDRDNRRGGERKRLRPCERVEELSFLSFQQKYREKRHHDNCQRKEYRPAHLLR